MEDLKQKQADNYIREAELTLESAQAIFDKAKEENKGLWANVVKCCYDAIEQAVSAALAKKWEVIPKDHPEKIRKFINLYKADKAVEKKLFFWLGKRGSSHYVDIKNDRLSVPHELFGEEDAEEAMAYSEDIICYIKSLISS